MSTFAQLISATGNVGIAYTLTVYDALTSPPVARYSTHALPGSTDWDPRLLMPGRLQRGLVPNFAIAASTVQVQLNNTDGGADWLITASTAATQVLQASFDLSIVAYALDNPSDLQSFDLGHYVLLDRPVADAGRITLSLADDSMGRAAELARAPSLLDWVEDAGTDAANCPLIDSDHPATGRGINIRGAPLLDVVSINAPVRLAFGHQPIRGVRCLEAAAFAPNSSSTVFVGQAAGGGAVFNKSSFDSQQLNGTGYTTTDANKFKRVLMVCATASGATDPHSNTKLYLSFPSPYDTVKADFVDVPKTNTLGAHQGIIWTGKRSQALTKDGRTWYLLYVIIDYEKLQSWWSATQLTSGVTRPLPLWSDSNWYVYVPLFSSMTYTPPLTGSTRPVTPAQIALDLLSYYSRGLSTAAGDIDVSSFLSVSDSQQAIPAWGIIADERRVLYAEDVFALPSPRLEEVGGQMRRALSEICASAQFDITTKWDGTIAAIPQTAYIDVADPTVAIAALTELDETRMVQDSWKERIPSEGERWAPHNRLFIQNRSGTTLGPFDTGNFFHGGFDIDNWGVILPLTLISKWVDYDDLVGDKVFAATGFEARARPVVTVRHPVSLLASVELGAYVLVSWTRGGDISARYSRAVFKVEGLTLIPANGELQLELVWYDDLATDLPYILDDETYTARVAATGGRTATVRDGTGTVSFSSGDLFADNVNGGDILILKDSSQGATVFSRYRALRIGGVDDVTLLHVTDADLDFGSPGGVAVVEWEIRRGYTTYPNLASDPTHYPNGSKFYGKVTNTSGVFSDSTAGNKLLSG
jgi:hypothetical protein